jgi:hypothetical protein
MKPQEIDKLRMLDVNGCWGSLQQLLMDTNINQIGYAEALYHLLAKAVEERGYYEKMYQKFFNVLTANNLMTNELLELEEKLA